MNSTADSSPVIGEIIEPPGSDGPVIIADGGERIACDGRMLAKGRYPLLYAQLRGMWGEDRHRFRVPALKPIEEEHRR